MRKKCSLFKNHAHQLSRQWKENQVVDEDIALINQIHGNIAIPNLANALRISPRSLERKFLQAVGISPKA